MTARERGHSKEESLAGRTRKSGVDGQAVVAKLERWGMAEPQRPCVETLTTLCSLYYPRPGLASCAVRVL